MSRHPLLDPNHALPEGCISGLTLEQLFCGELDAQRPTEAATLRTHLSACPACQERYAALDQARTAFQAQFSLPALAADLDRRLELLEKKKTYDLESLERTSFIERLQRWWAAWVPSVSGAPVWAGALAVAALGLVLVPRLLQPPPAYLGEKSALRAPGALEVYVLRGGEVRPALEGQSFQPGDRLQFLIRPGSYRYLHLVSLDSTGHLSAFFPEEGQQSLSLGTDGEQLLPEAIELDTFQGMERIFAVYTEEPMPWRTVKEAADGAVRAAGGASKLKLAELLELPLPGSAQVSFLMVKP